MDPRLLSAYNSELDYLRRSAGEFAEENPAVAGQLGPKFPETPDPYVERLLEGVAFLGARVRLKLDDQFPEFSQQLLHAVQPHYVAPTPSMAVLEFQPDDADPILADGPRIPRGAEVSCQSGGMETPCRFVTGQAVTLWPLRIAKADYLSTRVAIAGAAAAAGVNADAGLRLTIEASGPQPLSALRPQELSLYLAGSDGVAGELFRQLAGECVAVMAKDGVGWRHLPLPRPTGFDDETALLPTSGRALRVYGLLSEYFACPGRFLFIEFQGLDEAFVGKDRECEIQLLFNRNSPALQGALEPSNLRLNCAPAINLFSMPLGRTPISPHNHEHQIIADRTKPIDYEIFRLEETIGYDDAGAPRPMTPLYQVGHRLFEGDQALHYVARLRARRLSTREQRQRGRNEYVGSETWISLVAPGSPDVAEQIREVGGRALVTNRELPELFRTVGQAAELSLPDFPVRDVRFALAPSRPRAPMGLSDAAWRIITHLSPNYASLLDKTIDGAAMLRGHLALYARTDDRALMRQVDGLVGLAGEQVTRRVDHRGGVARGHLVRLRFDDTAYDDGQMFLFASVVNQFLRSFATINSFVETICESPECGEFAHWLPSLGERPTI